MPPKPKINIFQMESSSGNDKTKSPTHVNLSKTVFHVSYVNMFCLLSPACMLMTYQYTSGHMSICHFTMLSLLMCTYSTIIARVHIVFLCWYVGAGKCDGNV